LFVVVKAYEHLYVDQLRDVRPGQIVIQPDNQGAANQDLTLRDGAFQLSPFSKEHGWPTVIQVFLESLAHEWKGRAVVAILSGLDSDGANALRSITAV
jgi:chemotaxis response regulator CheB